MCVVCWCELVCCLHVFCLKLGCLEKVCDCFVEGCLFLVFGFGSLVEVRCELMGVQEKVCVVIIGLFLCQCGCMFISLRVALS